MSPRNRGVFEAEIAISRAADDELSAPREAHASLLLAFVEDQLELRGAVDFGCAWTVSHDKILFPESSAHLSPFEVPPVLARITSVTKCVGTHSENFEAGRSQIVKALHFRYGTEDPALNARGASHRKERSFLLARCAREDATR